MAKPLIRDWHLRFNFGGPRSTDSLIGIAIHTTENDPSTPAENVAQYQVDSESGSYNVLADRKGLLLENTDNWITWSTGNKGNSILLHLSFVARASMTRAQWLAEDAMLRHGAWQVAQWCQKYGWPVKHVDVWNLPGITTHDATRAWGGTDHTDPGPNFPWDVFLRYVNEEIAGPTSTTQENDMTVLSGVSAQALNIVRIGVTALTEPLKSVINPAKKFLLTDLVRFIDAGVWQNRVLLNHIVTKLGDDPQAIVDAAVKADREGK
ncbi:peptidoglycan recognition protein family protein [Corynebacterium glutamicum]|uniref:N-acetylmuramoyl-L-alanine amidase domain-containing protein n=2 Tax=Corynebacterium glutamicum TaxID=1718 RepID=Q5KRH7_CORGT|nr:N-acetylmuramoyl-L-alanine amidase [Corynebacterium glutamicum]BAD84076.1 hypothetical protein [Corynebacterium glutamicum]BAF54868.1 hypothetical protein cgR_1873 [Corynebacterium glutamicum R]